MRKIITSLSIIAFAAAMAISATLAYFNDTETSAGNTFTAGTLDLKIDLHCPDTGCNWSLRDLNGESFFHACDIKPGDKGEVTISWHVDNNDAWGRIKLADLFDYENGCNEPESKDDLSCTDPGIGSGELDENLIFTLWMDEGAIAGWQCPMNVPKCFADPLEGDDILNGVETVFATKTANELLAGAPLPGVLKPTSTYYLGMKWEVPSSMGNVIQTDSILTKIIMEVVQSRNNPNPWTP